jgi:SAM-dependent methyltransferase
LVGEAAESRTAALTRYHVLVHLPPGPFPLALALGPGTGGDYAALAGRVGRYIAIEPARSLWRSELAGTPVEFREPTLRGAIDLPDASLDLALAFGVLHHIPNVSEVLGEIARVLRPGAPLILREPIGWLGDFRQPRPGLTRHERGIPHHLMDRMLDQAGFTLVRKSFASFPGPRELAWRLGQNPWDHVGWVRLDAALARAMAWNAGYRRETLGAKLAPRLCYWLALRRPTAAGSRPGPS